MSTHFVIVGNGAAGYRAAKALRRADGDAVVSVFTEERYPFYLRRQLGEFLAGNLTLTELIFQGRNAYRRERIDLFLMTRLVRIDPDSHEVVFASGDRVRYDRLLLATGTQAVPLDLPGASLTGVAAFDTLSSALEVKRLVDHVRRAVLLGEGVIGLTIGESLVRRGIGVTQVLGRERYWPEVLDETTSALVEDLLEANGVVLRRQTEARAIIGAGDRVIGVETADGETLPAELVGCGCRRKPAIDVVQGSGLEVGRGLCVDGSLQTSRPDIFAAGDCAEPADAADAEADASPVCWQRAWTQGGIAAAGMLGQKPPPAVDAVRLRTQVFGVDLAVLGRGRLGPRDGAEVVETRAAPNRYRRLVFQEGRLVGAVVFGTGEWVHELNRLVAQRAPREVVETILGVGEPAAPARVLDRTFAQHCPICAAELVVYRGTPVGSHVRCVACNTELTVAWDGQRVVLDVSRP